MNTRWWWCCCVLALAAAAAAERGDDSDRDVPALDDGDDDLALNTEESRNLHPRAYQSAAYNTLPSGFRPSGSGGGGASLAELAGYSRPQQQSQQLQQQPQPQPQRPRGPQRPPPSPAQQQRDEDEELESEEEREEPDRLAQLLQQSRFDCSGKQTGYYADQELHCEVFHYCQENVKHSWICPDGFTFHQVHLICMPPAQAQDSICQQSAKYHFVNEYLYRPVNEEEVQRKPSLPLRYSDRYFPQEVYHDDRDDDDQEEEERPRPAPRPAASPAPPAATAQVFRSAEEVNIPLLQRRPQRPYEFRF